MKRVFRVISMILSVFVLFGIYVNGNYGLVTLTMFIAIVLALLSELVNGKAQKMARYIAGLLFVGYVILLVVFNFSIFDFRNPHVWFALYFQATIIITRIIAEVYQFLEDLKIKKVEIA